MSSLYWDRHFHHVRTTFFPTLSVEKRVDRLTVRVDHGGDGGCVHRREGGAVNEGSSWRLVEVCGAEAVVDAEGIGRWMAGGS